eukprot:Clim_evm41s210 gene=Clim_evmTU41s210
MLRNIIIPWRTGPVLARSEIRAYAQQAQQNVFDRDAKRIQRDRAAVDPEASKFDYVRELAADQIVERLFDIKRTFDTVADLGSGKGFLQSRLPREVVNTLINLELSKGQLVRELNSEQQSNDDDESETRPNVYRVQATEDYVPLKENSMDAIMSCLSMHWVNDLPGLFAQVNRALKPDAPFLGVCFGGNTLYELRCSLQVAEIERKGGFAPRVSPMISMRDMGNLLQRVGYNLLTIDSINVQVGYPCMFNLIEDIKGMGESNAALTRANFVSRDTLMAAAATYRSVYGNEDGTIPATFELIWFIGWKKDASQPKPLPRGSAEKSLKDIFPNSKTSDNA